jgi:hypothetical protein
MSETNEASNGNLDPVQATELSMLVDLEARWENLRNSPARNLEVEAGTHDLHGRQKAYDDFRARLVAYNNRYKPAHVPELLLNTPSRLGKWCRTMRDLFLQVENDGHARCPVHLLEKAYRWADRVGARLKTNPVTPPSAPATIQAAIRGLETLGLWCDELTRIAAPAGQPAQGRAADLPEQGPAVARQ